MPQARRAGSGSRSSAKSTRGGGQAKRSSGSSASGGRSGSSSRSTGSSSSSRSTRSSSSSRSTRSGGAKSGAKSGASKAQGAAGAATASAESGAEAAAQRLRKLNERIIVAGKAAGETTLTSYETALKAIARTLERGPGTSEIDWVSNLATTQAKFIRDVTTAWTSAARDVLK